MNRRFLAGGGLGAVAIELGEGPPLVRPLVSSTLVGRHWSCDVVLPDRRIPLRWLEIRWLDGTWGWRSLSDQVDTIGGGRLLASGWRAFQSRGVRLPGVGRIQLVEKSPPGLLLECLEDRSLFNGESIEEYLDRCCPSDGRARMERASSLMARCSPYAAVSFGSTSPRGCPRRRGAILCWTTRTATWTST